jgi:2-phosphoglycerate kinase
MFQITCTLLVMTDLLSSSSEYLRQLFTKVLWIGGATDAGKTSVARVLGEQLNWPLYEYDRTDLYHHTLLARILPEKYSSFMNVTLEESWINPTPNVLLQRSLDSFDQRFHFVAEELRAWTLPKDGKILIEGFGLTPALLAPLLSSPHQAIFLIPTEAFKRASMERRGKPAFAKETSDPAKARQNLLERDLLLALHIQTQAQHYGLKVVEVDGSYSVEKTAQLIHGHFLPFLKQG